MANPVTKKTLEELVDYASSQPPMVQAEFARRQTIMQREATDAAIEAAQYTKQNARYMLWSVAVLAVASIASLLVAIFK